MRSSICALFLILFMTGCTSHIATLQQDKHQGSLAITEIREQLADLRHELNNARVELQILDEQVKKKEHTTTSYASSKSSDSKLIALEKKMEQLSSHANQTSQCLSEYKAKIVDLEAALEKQVEISKATLSSLKSSFQGPQEVVHKVKAGDSLEKIARSYKVTVSALKEENRLSHDTIMVGQELKIPISSLP